MVHQHIAGQGGQPGGKCPFFNVIASHGPVNPDKNFLREVFGIIGRIGKPVAQVVDPLVE
jgi:hypothetical protein